MANDKMTKNWIMDYVKTNGNQSAIGLLLLGGIEEFDGSLTEYNNLIEELEKQSNILKIECDTNCIDCKNHYRCTSKMRLEDETRDFWLNEREYGDEYEKYKEEYEQYQDEQ